MTSDGKTRRDFIFVATGAVAAGGIVAGCWPMIAHMGPSADVRDPVYDIDVSLLNEGEQIEVVWQGLPIFIRHRTDDEIYQVENTDLKSLRYPESDYKRLKPHPDGSIDNRYIVLLGLCPNSWAPLVWKTGKNKGWHYSNRAHYDLSGRLLRGYSSSNMLIPNYRWISPTKLSLNDGFTR